MIFGVEGSSLYKGLVIYHTYTFQTVAFQHNQMGVVDMAESSDSISSEEKSE